MKKRYSGIIVQVGDKVLLAKRNNLGSFPGMWSIFGGRVEEGEETKDAAKREFFEETGIDIDNKELEFVGVIPRYTRDGSKTKGMMYVYRLRSEIELKPDLENAIDGEEHTEWGYFTKDQVTREQSGTYLYKLLQVLLQK
jgi:8-oxo-dGTP pyrophosphatase MutT (NUDIX family)